MLYISKAGRVTATCNDETGKYDLMYNEIGLLTEQGRVLANEQRGSIQRYSCLVSRGQ